MYKSKLKLFYVFELCYYLYFITAYFNWTRCFNWFFLLQRKHCYFML